MAWDLHGQEVGFVFVLRVLKEPFLCSLSHGFLKYLLFQPFFNLQEELILILEDPWHKEKQVSDLFSKLQTCSPDYHNSH